MAVATTVYDYYTGGGITEGLSDKQPYFTLNQKNITIYSGAFHYFRVPRAYWRDRLRKMRAAGLNTVETYIPWNLHEPQSGLYDFGEGMSDFDDFLHMEEFLKTAQEEDMLALVRPGPYICSEWEFGGLPSWILRNTTSIRSSKDQTYLDYVKRYFNILLPLLAVLQFQKGGPIIGFQIENEFGNTGVSDLPYLKFIQNLFVDNGITELLYTSDSPNKEGLGAIPGILQTANFNTDPKWQLDKLNTLQKNKPTMAMEFWTGWYDHWTEGHQTMESEKFRSLLTSILDYPASVNHYMFVGSTNFGFLNGANSLYAGQNNSGLQPDTTSYDYDSPMTEYGGYTTKYDIVKELIAKHNPVKIKNPEQPKEPTLVQYPSIKINGTILLSDLIDDAKHVLTSENVIPMEKLPINDNSGQSYGYIVYRKTISNRGKQVVLKIKGYVRDTVLVLVNGKLVSPVPKTADDINGFGFWKMLDSTLPLENITSTTYVIDLVVENIGRNNFGTLDQFQQFKGLIDDVYIDDQKVTQWKIIPFEFKTKWNKGLMNWGTNESRKATPTLYKFHLDIENDPQDSFIDMREWTKGIVIVNGFVLGRHFFVGPQQTLYLPAPLLKKGRNYIIVFEHYDAPDVLKFSNKPIYGSREQPSDSSSLTINPHYWMLAITLLFFILH